MINLENFTYNGFKLYRRSNDVDLCKTTVHMEYDIIIQYKSGIPYKAWSQEILESKTGTEERWHNKNPIDILDSGDIFIRNLTEDEMFSILL